MRLRRGQAASDLNHLMNFGQELLDLGEGKLQEGGAAKVSLGTVDVEGSLDGGYLVKLAIFKLYNQPLHN
ncbi:hypothetical protein PGTUg99_017002 [Puccinia graminis f. sp. tritici]|uniref:Uncharacterized protein n=1 Tax=Puccinia graminis f. sp. tritici TaxID=56615 RepID=A0A5B0RY68_PUCGR|nr:hypothetical protein PGTUg99_017002 [Puccinia graminis f. sp. tritici]